MRTHVTPKEIEAQRAKRDRRYASSIGKGYCMLTRAGRMCPDPSVRKIGDTYVCQRHSDLLDAIKRDANKARARRPNFHLQRAIA